MLSVNGAYDVVGMLHDGIIPSAGSERTAPPVAFEQPPRAAKKLSERSTDEGSPLRQQVAPLVFRYGFGASAATCALAVQPTRTPDMVKIEFLSEISLNSQLLHCPAEFSGLPGLPRQCPDPLGRPWVPGTRLARGRDALRELLDLEERPPVAALPQAA